MGNETLFVRWSLKLVFLCILTVSGCAPDDSPFRAENEVLKNQMAAAESERLHLRQTMTAARERLEGLVDKIPEDA